MHEPKTTRRLSKVAKDMAIKGEQSTPPRLAALYCLHNKVFIGSQKCPRVLRHFTRTSSKDLEYTFDRHRDTCVPRDRRTGALPSPRKSLLLVGMGSLDGKPKLHTL